MKYPTRYTDFSHSEIQQLIPNASLILEVGCNDGLDTVELLAHNPFAVVLCWECDPRAISAWHKNVGVQHRARLHEHAVAAEPSVRTFWQSSGSPIVGEDIDWDKSGSLFEPTAHLRYSPWCTFDKKIQVLTSALDSCISDAGYEGEPIDFWRLDVQGAELEVFRGGEVALKNTKYVLAECHTDVLYRGAPTESEMVTFMGERGFECSGRFAADLLFARTA